MVHPDIPPTTGEFARIEGHIHASTALNFKLIAFFQGLSETETVRRAAGLFAYGTSLDKKGGELFRPDTGERVPLFTDLSDETQSFRFGVNVNPETEAFLDQQYLESGQEHVDTIEQAVHFMGRVVAANVAQVALQARRKSD